MFLAGGDPSGQAVGLPLASIRRAGASLLVHFTIEAFFLLGTKLAPPTVRTVTTLARILCGQ